MKTFYRRSLPHIQPVGASYFITFRLFDSVPKTATDQLTIKYEEKLSQIKLLKDIHQRNLEIFNCRKMYLVELDQLLDKIKSGPHFLKEPIILTKIAEELRRHDGHLYTLVAYCIMSNHVHLVIDTKCQEDQYADALELHENYKTLDKIMKQIKGATARIINLALKRTGKVWQRESYDIFIRNETMLNNVISYTLQNPVKAGLVEEWDHYKGSYFVGTLPDSVH